MVAWTAEFFRHIGKSVITMDREVPGFIANRLQEALWREALHMVATGEATVEQIDASITDGPRAALGRSTGRCLTFHLAGGPGGMAHMLDHFDRRSAAVDPACRRRLTPELRDRVVEGCEAEAAGRTVADLVRERDPRLVAILKALGTAPAGLEAPVRQ